MKTLLSAAAAVTLAATLAAPMTFASTQVQTTANPLAGINVQKLIKVTSADGLQTKALKAALNAYAWARSHGKLGSNTSTLTVVDFSLPSYEKRLWVIDLKNDTVLMKLHTSQGKYSGVTYATHFSNKNGSKESSLGLYVTSNEYSGHHGVSMRLNGLEKGINNNARARAIVIHDAAYVTPGFIKAHHRTGRSWGCFAVNPKVKNQLLQDVKGGSALFAYAAAENHDPIAVNGPVAFA